MSFGVKGEVFAIPSLCPPPPPLIGPSWLSLDLGSSQGRRAVCHFDGGAGRGGARAGGRGAEGGAYAAGRGERRGLGGGRAEQTGARGLAHVEQGRMFQEQRGGKGPTLAPGGPHHHLFAALKTGKRQLATTGC